MNELIRNDKEVYIHCTAGMGRAPACAVAYLRKKMELNEAVAHVKQHRIVTVPNAPVLTEVLANAQERRWDSVYLEDTIWIFFCILVLSSFCLFLPH